MCMYHRPWLCMYHRPCVCMFKRCLPDESNQHSPRWPHGCLHHSSLPSGRAQMGFCLLGGCGTFARRFLHCGHVNTRQLLRSRCLRHAAMHDSCTNAVHELSPSCRTGSAPLPSSRKNSSAQMMHAFSSKHGSASSKVAALAVAYASCVCCINMRCLD